MQVLIGLPRSQHVWTRAERSTFHGLIAPSARKACQSTPRRWHPKTGFENTLKRARIFAQDEHTQLATLALVPTHLPGA